MALTVLEGSTFCICDDRGDIGDDTSGFFAKDTRFLSRLRLTVNGERPLLLSSDKVEYFSAAFFMRNPVAGGLEQDALAIARERFVGDGMQDRIGVQSLGMEPVTFELGLEVEADFADIFTVKARDFTLGDPLGAPPLPPPVRARWEAESGQFVLEDVDQTFGGRTQVILSEPGAVDEAGRVSWSVTLEPRQRWELTVDVLCSNGSGAGSAPAVDRHFGDELARIRESLAAWHLRVPRLRTSWDGLAQSFNSSVADLASLRMSGSNRVGNLPAAGMPWFMAVFGRDTLITCLQTLLFGPELARNALESLAELQAEEEDPSIDAEPGKIVHEVRQGKAAAAWFRAYYGTVDATPLYLVLLSEVWRWTGDAALVTSLREPAMRALEWIDRWGDRDGDGFIEYERRADGGLVNQSWKDSGDSQRFHDGRFAEGAIAPCEVQGYVYDARRRMAELAREVWRDRPLAERLDAQAEELRRRFDEAFWVDERGGYYALALDGEKQRVDALASNVGHLLWSGIVPPERLDAVVDALMEDGLWSGWGVLTMSSEAAAYNPLSYHNGSVWPHDNSLIAWGLARSGRWDEARRIARAMLDAAEHFHYQLPEVFAGLPRSETPFPIAYPTAARPQAWAAGAPVLMLQLLLGLRPDPRRQELVSDASGDVPSWAGAPRVSGVRAFGRVWSARVEDGEVVVEET